MCVRYSTAHNIKLDKHILLAQHAHVLFNACKILEFVMQSLCCTQSCPALSYIRIYD